MLGAGVAVRTCGYVALVLSAVTELRDVELAEVEAAVGSSSFKRGRSYARGNRVAAIEWDANAERLTGSVIGQGALYDTAAFFTADSGGELAFDEGECSCPVGYNCKHVAAIVIVATDGRGAGRPGRLRRPPRQLGAAEPRSWEKPLRALIDAPAARATGNALAVELALHDHGIPGRGAPRLMARLMRPGARGGWVNGSLAWSGLDSWHVQSGEYRRDHLALVEELYAVHRARERRTGYYYGYGADKMPHLGGCDSPRLWSLLDEAARLGLMLVHERPGLGEVRRYGRGELFFDVTRRGDQGWLVSAVLRVDGEDAAGLEPLLFLGSSGHGIVCVERADVTAGDDPRNRPLRLVRLAKATAPQLQRMILDGERLEIPASEFHRFADELCPALRNVAPVISSDGSCRSRRLRSPRRRSCCARATVPITPSR